MYLKLDTQLTAEGIECRHPVLGKVATIQRQLVQGNEWYVSPYRFPPYERGARFKSRDAAEHYALALAYEMHHLQLMAPPARKDHEKYDTAAASLASVHMARSLRTPKDEGITEHGPRLARPNALTGPDGEDIPDTGVATARPEPKGLVS